MEIPKGFQVAVTQCLTLMTLLYPSLNLGGGETRESTQVHGQHLGGNFIGLSL
jgi:hypothetical protein